MTNPAPARASGAGGGAAAAAPSAWSASGAEGSDAPEATNRSAWPRRSARRPTSSLLLGQHEGDAVAAAARAAGAADAVHVVVVALRRVEVDHVRDVVDVEPAGGDVRRDERRDAPALELLERALALVLREVAVHRDGRDLVLALELADELVRAVLGADEDEREAAVDAEVLDEPVELVLGRDQHERVVDLAALRLGRQHAADVRRVHRVGAGELGDGAVEGGAEEHRLPVRRHAREDAVDLRLEAHVEHPVGLVEHEHADAVELDGPALDQVEEAAGSRDEDVGLARLVDLAADGRAAVDGGDVEALRRGERRDVRRDLQGELARRHEDERAREGVPRGGALDERQPEGERLAGARRRLGEDVESGERVGEDEVLDGEGFGDPLLGEHVGDRRADAELLKGRWHCSTPCLWFVRDATSSNNPRKRRNEEPDLHETQMDSFPEGSSGAGSAPGEASCSLPARERCVYLSGLSFLTSSTNTNDCSSASTSRQASCTSGFAPTMYDLDALERQLLPQEEQRPGARARHRVEPLGAQDDALRARPRAPARGRARASPSPSRRACR